MTEIALFPLKTVLLPGSRLALKVFEPRYTDMVADCMREQKPFGIVLIYHGEETEREVDVFTIGTTAIVSDWQNRDDGLLGITALGQDRFKVNSTRTATNGLLIADIEILECEEVKEIPHHFYYMKELLEHISSSRAELEVSTDFNQIVYQLIYLLPLDNKLKQQLLEVPSCSDRAVALHAELIRLGVIQYVKPGSEKKYTSTSSD